MLHQPWKQHLAQLESTPRFSFHLVQHLPRVLPWDPVIDHGDHEQVRITISCPKLYRQGALNTWSDTDLLERFRCITDPAQLVISSAFLPYVLKHFDQLFSELSGHPLKAVSRALDYAATDVATDPGTISHPCFLGAHNILMPFPQQPL